MIPFSVLDLSPINEGSDAGQAFRNTLDLARHAERWGYRRFWLAEHHNMPGIASAATAVVIGYVAGGTKAIRVGSGGVMLPNHAPLMIAEQFGTLESLYPGRIDLGLGRAPGTDQRTARALRRDSGSSGNTFPQDVLELQAYLAAVRPGQAVQAVPGAGLEVPLWILGSSLFGAQLAAALGLPYAFASHFAPDALMQALEVYRATFKPSQQLAQPYAMACINVFAAATDGEARRLFTSLQQQFINLRRGNPGRLRPPIDDIRSYCSLDEKAMVDHALMYSMVGTPDAVHQRIEAFVQKTEIDELMITGQIYDHAARLRSFEIAAQLRDSMSAASQRSAAF